MSGRRSSLTTALIGLILAAGAGADDAPARLRFRARVTRLTPEAPARIHWRWGGEGLGGKPVTGEITAVPPNAPTAPPARLGAGGEAEVMDLEEDAGPKDRVIVEGKACDYHYMRIGAWSPWAPASVLKSSGRRRFVTFTLEGHEVGRALKDGEVEFEFAHGDDVIKRFRVAGPDGPTFGVVVPLHRVGKDGKPTLEFEQELGSLLDYTTRRAEFLEAQPWAKHPGPKRYGVATDCSGYSTGSGYGVRTTDKATILAEYRALRAMGFNGIRGCPAFLYDMIRTQTGLGRDFSRILWCHTSGYPIAMIKRADGKPPIVHPGDGCPFHPDNLKGIPSRVAAAVETLMDTYREMPVEEVWGLTVDEIGTVFDGAPEGKAHQGCCPYCREAFREMIRADGRTLADFGAPDWNDIRSTYGYWARSYWDIRREREEALKRARANVQAQLNASLGAEDLMADGGDADDAVIDQLDDAEGEPAPDAAEELLAADKRMEELIWNNRAGQPKASDSNEHRLSPAGWDLLHYYSRRFNNEAAAGLFAPLRDAFAAENRKKKQALDSGATDTPAARQPWIHSYALRGNTFLMGGHSLDFFDFYRYADNAFCYETSNRDRRVWQWDSYLCDVGRSLSRFMGKRFGIYVKPHRGAPIQRALTAAARGARVIFWYTYGPEWKKGDSFAGRQPTLEAVGRANHLIARGEDVTYDADWALPAEIAIVRPAPSEFFGNSASWENGKWVYTALMHAHLPVDALDEGLLMSEDLSRYKAIYISGSHIRKDVAAKLAQWVAAGGTLYSCGGGLARDESNVPLDATLPVLGLKSRAEPELWGSVSRYGATALRPVRAQREPPDGAQVTGRAPFEGHFVPAVGREVLDPLPDAEVLATYADGGAAAVRHRHGKGQAYLVGFYAGMEYAVDTMEGRPYRADKRAFVAAPALAAGVRPVVNADAPLVDGVLLRNRNSGKLAAILINWQFHIEEPVTVTIRGAGRVTEAVSAALDTTFAAEPAGDSVRVVLPRLDEGDILLLE